MNALIRFIQPLSLSLLATGCFFVPTASGQLGSTVTKPTPIASTKIGDQILELHLVERGNRDQQTGSGGFNFFQPSESESKSINQELGITPWTKTFGQIGARELLLSFLLMNQDGTLADAMLTTFTSHRAVNTEGVESRYWPALEKNPLEEMTGKIRELDFPGSPMFVTVPPQTTTLKTLEGFVLIAESVSGKFEFQKEDFRKKFEWDKGIAMVPLVHEVVPQGLGFRLEMLIDLQYLSRQNSQSPMTPLAHAARILSKSDPEYTLVLPDNSTKPSNARGMLSITSKAQSDLMADIKKKIKTLRESGINRADDLKFITDGKNVSFELVSVGFNDQKDFKALIVEYVIPTAPAKISRFVMENIPIEPAGDREALLAYVNQAKIEARNRREAEAQARSEMPSADFRTWKDKTGNFSIDAKLIEVKTDAVVLEKTDGKQITVPKSKLSDKDLEFLGSR
jgi:hypothetical protein